MLGQLGRFAARHNGWFLVVWLMLAVALGIASERVGGTTHDVFSIPGTEAQSAVDILEREFPAANGGSATAVFHATNGKVTDPANQAAIEQSFTGLQAIEGVSPIISPFPSAGGQPSITAGNISTDQTVVYVTIQFSQPVTELPTDIVHQLQQAATPAAQAGLDVQFGGSVVDVFNAPKSWLSEHGDDIGLAVAVVILLISLGTATATLVPIGTALFTLGVSTSTVQLLERHFTIGSIGPILGTMIGLGVGIDYSLFIVSRYRQNLAEGLDRDEAVGVAVATAGSAVVFAGLTVCLALAALGIMGVPYVTEIGLTAVLYVLVAVLGALTFLPALLGRLGTRINSLKMPWHSRLAEVPEDADSPAFAARFARRIAHQPWLFASLSFVVLLALAAPVLRMDLGFPTDGSAPTDTTQRKAYDLMTQGFGPGANGPLVIVGPLPANAAQNPGQTLQTISGFVQKLEQTPGVQRVVPGSNPPDFTIAFITVYPTTDPNDPATAALVSSLRDRAVPQALEGTQLDPSGFYVGGATAQLIDLTTRIGNRMWLIIGVVLAGSFVLLMMVFRSLFVPFKAAIMNLLSIGASFGVLVAMFQWGWGRHLIGLQEAVVIAAFVPIMMFAILFGLSMDYEVFLLSRIREEYLRTGDSRESVVVGLANTARVITSAALIMIAVFLSQVTNPDPTVKMIGVGLAVAVFVDATIVRMVLVPSTMELMGRANWWLPRWLDRILPHINVDAPPPTDGTQVLPVPVPAPEPVSST